MITLLIVLGFLLACFVVHVLCFWTGAKLARAKRNGLLRAIVAVLLLFAIGLPLGWLTGFLLADQEFHWTVWLALAVFVHVLTLLGVVALVFRPTFRRSFIVVLTSLLGSGVLCLFLFFVIQPFVLELFIIPTQGMAPTLRGPHVTETCPRCGGVALFGLFEMPDQREPFRSPKGICESCGRHVVFELKEGEGQTSEPHAPDRIAVNKLLKPRRWDLVVFRYPKDEEAIYVQRLVGLPGETLTIRDGELWINGERMQRPAEIAKIRVRAFERSPHFDFAEPTDNPKTYELGPNDLFVIGDNTELSSDSRDWGPVPRENVMGVTGLIYWPASRWRLFR